MTTAERMPPMPSLETGRFEARMRPGGGGLQVRLNSNPEAFREWSREDLLKDSYAVYVEVEEWCTAVLRHLGRVPS